MPVRRYVLAPIAPAKAPARDAILEPAWDGHRMLATVAEGRARLVALDFRDWTATFPSVARALAKLSAKELVIDGVVCVFDDRGAPSFEALRERVQGGAVATAVMICWDVLAIDGEDLRELPARERRARLTALLAGAPPSLVLSQVLEGALDRVLAATATLGIRGVVSRGSASTYTAGWATHGEPVDWQRSLSPPPPLSNPDKVLFPRDGICKRDLVGYYRDLAPVIVPYLVDRPVVIQRWPDGLGGDVWYQHRMPPRAPDYLRAAFVDGVRRVVIENLDALAWMANQAGITYHSFQSRLTTLSEPDYVTIDLDPSERTQWWAEMITVAHAVRTLLELLELPSVVKTSGKRGLHILVPIAPGHTFAHAEELARGVASMVARLHPDVVSTDIEREKRANRLLIDTKQHVAKLLVAPYSLRGADGATASTPIAWDEVSPALDPRAFTLHTLRARLQARGDLAAPLLAGTAILAPALERLRAGA